MRDLRASINYYIAALGFKLNWETPNFVEVRAIAAASCFPKATKGAREVSLTIPQLRDGEFLDRFRAAWEGNLITPLPGTLLHWPAD